MRALRPARYYQVEAEAAALSALRKGHRGAVVVMPTGTGKTRVMQGIAQMGAAHSRRILVLAHTDELVGQALAAMEAACGLVGLEKARSRAMANQIIVACDASMAARLHDYPPNFFHLIMSDECHLDMSDRRLSIFAHFFAAKIIGFTATPARADGISLESLYDGGVAYQYPILRAIKDGYLVPVHNIEIDVSSVNVDALPVIGGDFDDEALSDALATEAAVDDLVVPIMRECADRRTIIFCKDIRQSQAISDRMNAYRSGCADSVWGVKHGRAEILRRHRAGSFQFLSNPSMLDLGYDDPGVHAVVMGEPTMSFTRFAQRAGRGMRLAEGAKDIHDSISKGKRDCLLLTFKGGGVHRLISVEDLMAGRKLSDEELAVARDLRRSGEPLERAANPERLHDIVEERAQQSAAAARMAANVEYIARSINPFVDPPIVLAERFERAASDQQIRALKKIGVQTPSELSSDDAAAILEAAASRKRSKLCSLKMARWLESRPKICEALGVQDPAQCDPETARRAFNIAAGVEPWPGDKKSGAKSSLQSIASLEIESDL